MSEPVKKAGQTPGSYSQKDKPEIVSLAEEFLISMQRQAETPELFRKEILRLPESVIVGKKVTYSIEKQGKGENPPLSLIWDECKRDGTFDALEKQENEIILRAHLGLYFNINSNGDGCFSYIVGVLVERGTAVPDGFACHAIPESDAAICWFRYKDGDDIWSVAHGSTEKYMDEQGYTGIPETGWCSELYPFSDIYKTETDDNILGYLIACKEKE